MMNRICKTNIIKRSLLVGMAAVTFFTSLAAPAKAAFADTYDDYYEDYDESSMPESEVSSLIKMIAGKIPYGDMLKAALGPMLKEMLGTNDDTPEKLNEISRKIDALEVKMDENAQKQLEVMYKSSRLTQFNNDITTVRNMTANYYSNVKIILSNEKSSEAEKAALIGALLDTNEKTTTDYLTVVGTLTSFVNGDQINDNPESILVASYNANCASSMLGSEAAMRNAAYVQNVTTILDYSYKLEALVLDSRIILANILSNMTKEEKEELKKKFDGCTAELNLIAECGREEKVNIWKKNAGINAGGELTGVKRKYYLALDQDNPKSAVSKYNAMVKKNWCSFIKAKDYSGLRAKITMIPLRLAVGKDHNASKVGVKKLETYCYGGYKKLTENISNRLNDNIKNSPLTPQELTNLIKHINKDPIFARPKDSEWMLRLDYIGFNAKEAYKYADANGEDEIGIAELTIYLIKNPIFITSAEAINRPCFAYRGIETNKLQVGYISPTGDTGYIYPINFYHDIERMKLSDHSNGIYYQYLWFEKADSEVYSNEEADNACYMPEIEAINKELIEALRIDEVEEEEEVEEDDIYAATDLTVVWNTRDGQMIPKEDVSVEIGYGVTLTATSSNNWKSEVVDLILYDETGDYAYNFVDDSLYGLISELSDDFIVTTDVITEKGENGFDERHFIVYCDAIAEEDVPEYDDPVIFEEDDPEYDDPVIYEDEPEYDGPIILYEDIPEYDVSETYGDGIYW